MLSARCAPVNFAVIAGRNLYPYARYMPFWMYCFGVVKKLFEEIEQIQFSLVSEPNSSCDAGTDIHHPKPVLRPWILFCFELLYANFAVRVVPVVGI
jgi:hypothetical protein